MNDIFPIIYIYFFFPCGKIMFSTRWIFEHYFLSVSKNEGFPFFLGKNTDL